MASLQLHGTGTSLGDPLEVWSRSMSLNHFHSLSAYLFELKGACLLFFGIISLEPQAQLCRTAAVQQLYPSKPANLH